MPTYYIYTLTDPRDQQVRYVGQSANPAQRMVQHLNSEHNVRPGKEVWFKELLQSNLVPTMAIVDKAKTKSEARTLEAYWILHHLNNGANLVNGEVIWAGEAQGIAAQLIQMGQESKA